MELETTIVWGRGVVASAMGEHLSKRGHSVVVASIDSADSLESGSHSEVEVEASAREVVKEATRQGRRLGAVVSVTNTDVTSSVGDLSTGQWRRVMLDNLTAPFLLAKHAVPHLTQTNGSFVSVIPYAGSQGLARSAAGVASLHGNVGLVRSIALDYAPSGVRSNVVCYGLIEGGRADPRVPFGRAGSPEDVAALVHHLCSSEASYTNGTVQFVDGGLSAGYFDPRPEDGSTS